MKSFSLNIECNNDAFVDAAGDEIARILRDTANRIANGELDNLHAYWVRDVNGNRVGTYKFEER